MNHILLGIWKLLRPHLERHPRLLFELYPPYLGTGITVPHISEDFRRVVVEMPLRPYNKNYVGTHFGGSLYAMCDPFFMLMVIRNLGRDYIVWDKAGTIRFRRPGRGTVRAEFTLTDEELVPFRALLPGESTERVFSVDVRGDDGTVVAEVEKTLYVRRK